MGRGRLIHVYRSRSACFRGVYAARHTERLGWVGGCWLPAEEQGKLIGQKSGQGKARMTAHLGQLPAREEIASLIFKPVS
jgi:hypothetical protein